MKRKPSLNPQQIEPGVWYYENRGFIEVFINTTEKKSDVIDGVTIHTKIPKRKLIQSLARMR